MDRVVIGEAVELDVRTARLPSRALGLALDVIIMIALLVAVLLTMSLAGAEVDEALGAAVSIVITVGVFVGYPLLWETLTRGRSPGKYAMGLRVVRTDGGPIVFRHALARALAGFIVDFGLLSLFTGLVGVVVSASSARGQRVGDLLAGTVVVRERLPGSALDGLPPADPRLAAWARQCELALPDDLALAARQFLVRAAQLAGPRRAELGALLAADVAARVAPPPPPGVPPEAYLLAVLGERRRRESARLGATPWAGAPTDGSGTSAGMQPAYAAAPGPGLPAGHGSPRLAGPVPPPAPVPTSPWPGAAAAPSAPSASPWAAGPPSEAPAPSSSTGFAPPG
ncbi:RDD family protein [Actinomycetospora straminea]|uniref:RDD domain-containing protein n=1 Tax=Actinomycetospora straminea TaxID=663607 RepID=A0ABP9DSA9_9PSEU|nr:RDD family protein [Actinomycetospora straminea]MDD7935242.1 RDD family protein [Actinomycetospora straminea]